MVELLIGVQVVFGIMMFVAPQMAVTFLLIIYYHYQYDLPDREERKKFEQWLKKELERRSFLEQAGSNDGVLVACLADDAVSAATANNYEL